jgi:dihydropyrimidinase
VALDLAIRGGTLVVPGEGLFAADVGVVGEQVALVATPGALPEAARTIDASGKYVLPGIVDPHAHFGVQTGFAQDVEHETRAALLGGVTTIGAFLREPVSYHEVFPRFRAELEQLSSVDIFFHIVISTEEHLAEMADYAERYGVTSFKAYLAGMHGLYRGVDDGFLLQLLQQAAALGDETLVCLHAENLGIVDRATARVTAALGDAPGTLADWSAARPDAAEEEAIARSVFLGRLAGARVYIVHLTSGRGAERVRALKAEYPRLYAETVTHYLSLDVENPLGAKLKRLPPLRTAADVEALWAAVADGTVDTLGTDQVVATLAIKQPERGVLAAQGGFTTEATHLPVILTEGYHRRGLPLLRLVETMTAAPARLFRLYPRKGTIAVGSDADLVVVDLDSERRVAVADLPSWSDFSPWDGVPLRGWPTTTVLRGQVAMEDGRLLVAPGTGRYLSRAAPAIAAGERT